MRKVNLPYDYLIVHSLKDLREMLNHKNMWTPKTLELIEKIIKNK